MQKTMSSIRGRPLGWLVLGPVLLMVAFVILGVLFLAIGSVAERASGQELAMATVGVPAATVIPACQSSSPDKLVVHVTEDMGVVQCELGDRTLTAYVEEIVTSDPSGLYKKPLDPPSALDRFARPVVVAPPVTPGLLDGVFGPYQVGVPGANVCYAHAEVSQLGSAIYKADFATAFNIAPYSNLTDWSFTSFQEVTPWGWVQNWKTESINGFIVPMGYYEPGIVSVLWQSGSARFLSPARPPGSPPVTRDTLSLSEFINSPGVVPDTLCDEEWTLDTDNLIGGGGGGGSWPSTDGCGDRPWWCFPVLDFGW